MIVLIYCNFQTSIFLFLKRNQTLKKHNNFLRNDGHKKIHVKNSESSKPKGNIFFDPVQIANNPDLWESMKKSYETLEYRLKDLL